jgi:hypothetical protein
LTHGIGFANEIAPCLRSVFYTPQNWFQVFTQNRVRLFEDKLVSFSNRVIRMSADAIWQNQKFLKCSKAGRLFAIDSFAVGNDHGKRKP